MSASTGRIAARTVRRPTGVYYTPTDVAEFTVRAALDRLPTTDLDVARVLDPAVGTGVFLRAAAHLIAARTSRRVSDIVSTQLFGIDISATSIRSTVFVLTELAIHDAGTSPYGLWLDILPHVRQADSTTILPPGADGGISDLFPQAVAGFDVIVGNPPFSRIPIDHSSPLRRRLFESMRGSTGRTPAYLPFTELCWLFSTGGQSAAALVLPLSVATNRDSAHRRLRSALTRTAADWDFWCFDRTPDSLFGDDVKTRNTILVMRRHRRSCKAPPMIRTTSLRRWGITNRRSALSVQDDTLVDISSSSITHFVPKIGSETERAAYMTLKHQRHVDRVCTTPAGSEYVLASTTAYNWLPLIRQTGTTRTQRATTILCFPDADSADCAYATLMSRLTYWLWRVVGDGFHLTASFLRELPLPFDAFGTASANH